jgi:hypothetical protein
MLQTGRSRVRVPMRVLNFFNLRNPSICTMTLGLTQPETERSTRKCFWVVERGRGISLTTKPPSVSWLYRMWDTGGLKTVWASTASYGDSFIFLTTYYYYYYYYYYYCYYYIIVRWTWSLFLALEFKNYSEATETITISFEVPFLYS